MSKVYIILIFIITNFNSAFLYSQVTNSAIIEKINTESKSVYFQHIYSIETDDKGYIYLATENGIYIYNGTTISVYNKYLTGSSNEYVKFYKPNSNTLFAFPFEGKLTKLGINGNRQFKKIEDQNSDKYTIHNSYMNIDSSYKFIGRINIVNSMTLRIEKNNYNKYQIKINNVIDNYKEYKYYIESKTGNKELQNEILENIKKNNDNEIGLSEDYFISKDKIYYLNKDSSKLLIDLKKFNIEGLILNINTSKNNAIYICIEGKDKGLYKYENNTIKKIYTDDDVTNIVFDTFGNLFFSTLHLGLYKIKKENLDYNILSEKNIRFEGLNLDKKNNRLYANDIQGNLYNINIKNNSFDKKISNNYEIKKSKIIPTDSTLLFALIKNNYRIENSISKISPTSKRQNVSITSVFYTEFKHQFVTVNKYLISHVDNITNQIWNANTNSKVNYCYDINDSTILFITKSGLYNYSINEKKIFKITTNTEIDGTGGLQILKEKNKLYYLSNNSIYVSDDQKKFVQFFKSNLQNPIIKILFTNNNNLLCITSSGYLLFNQNKENLITFEIEENKYDKEIKGGYLYDSLLILYNTNQLYKIPVYAISYSNLSATAYLSSISYNSDTIEVSQNIIPTFKYSRTGIISFNFDLFNVNHSAQKITYSLLYNNETAQSKNALIANNLEFTTLMPGDYKLILFSNNKILITQKFTISPLWYQNMLFKIFLFFIILGLLSFFIYKIALRNANIKNEKEQQKNKLFKLESFAKLNQLKSHFIFNAFSPLQNYILRKQNDNAITYLHNFSDLLRSIMNMASIDYISLKDEIKFLTSYLDIQIEEKSNSFSYEIKNNINSQEAAFIKIPTLLIQPIIENSINYGITSISPQKGFISIEFLPPTEDYLLPVIISDNGTGTNDLFKKDNDEKLHAMQIIKERLDLISHHRKDLIQFKKTPIGFEIKIYLPIK